MIVDSACDWAVRIYEKLITGLEAKSISAWYNDRRCLLDCTNCEVERGCCKKRKLMMAMTSRCLDWLKRHQHELGDIDFGADDSVDMITQPTIEVTAS